MAVFRSATHREAVDLVLGGWILLGPRALHADAVDLAVASSVPREFRRGPVDLTNTNDERPTSAQRAAVTMFGEGAIFGDQGVLERRAELLAMTSEDVDAFSSAFLLFAKSARDVRRYYAGQLERFAELGANPTPLDRRGGTEEERTRLRLALLYVDEEFAGTAGTRAIEAAPAYG